MVPKADSGAFLLLFLLVLTVTEPLRPEVTGESRPYHEKEAVDPRQGRARGGNPMHFHAVNGAQAVRFSSFLGKCPTGWHHYEGTASCYRVYLSGENYWDAAQTCQRVNGSLATFSTDQELHFVLAQEWDQPERSFAWQDQHKLWVGYRYVITGRNRSLEGHWEVAFKSSSEVFLPPNPIFASAMSESDNMFCAQLQCFHFPTLRHHDLHSWHAENCYEKSSFLCKRSQTCVDIKDNVVDEGFYFTPKGDDPCLSCTCHRGEAEMCVAALCERPQGCQQYRKDPKECCKFMCLDPDGNSLFDSMASGMRLIVSCISSFLILSLLLFMVHRLRQRRRERIESLIGANLHHFNLGRRIPGFDYGPDGFGTGLTPLHLSDDGEGGTFHFHDPPPPYTAFKYPDIDQPDDPPPPYEASINPDSVFYDPTDDDAFEPAEAGPPTPGDGDSEGVSPRHLEQPLPPAGASLADLNDSADSSSALLEPPDPAQRGSAPATEALSGGGHHSRSSLNTVV
ncbi:integral membrane protein DGCR2/IDD isoform X4 [Pteropus medius]|uniref:Integral membrane protein DGCR2/IDD isoform X4 n=1 Tax=Pteropus vampyrus TaxID=132908 RepID=A0A6P3PZ60_PTEVA|nr:integral membrane protein DGCR2/IDD isoform X4 [Pteropus vampyrus]XP_039724298.1 integral membrane protein DGCR2/IDD isoform X4 [Pteropus giganteus]